MAAPELQVSSPSLFGECPLPAGTGGMAPLANAPQVGKAVVPAGLGLDDVIDLGGPPEAAGVPQLADVTVPLERPHPLLRPVAPIGRLSAWILPGPDSAPVCPAPGRAGHGDAVIRAVGAGQETGSR